jgi:hypothetical protein
MEETMTAAAKATAAVTDLAMAPVHLMSLEAAVLYVSHMVDFTQT